MLPYPPPSAGLAVMAPAFLRAIGAAAVVLILVASFGCAPPPARPVAAEAVPTTGPDSAPPATGAAVRRDAPDVIYGRVTDVDGSTYEGRLRWGGDQEAFWSDHFDGWKRDNSWAVHVTRRSSAIEIFGLRFGGGDRRTNLERPFMARFGDLARLDADFAVVQVTLKSGTTFELNRFEAGDIDDGVRVWDRRRGTFDLDARRVRTIEFLPDPAQVSVPAGRVHGTVSSRVGDFTGFVEWDSREGLSTDTLDGTHDGRARSLRYDTIQSIARAARDTARVTLRDGRELLLAGGREVGPDNRGIYVDDPRYGRVRISWEAFDRVEFTPAGSRAAYRDFPPGRPLTGSVLTRDGRRLAGRLVYDVDESETTDTLDVSVQGVDYSFPFDMIASVLPHGRGADDTRRPTVILRSGEEVGLEPNGDLAAGNGGVLIFIDTAARPAHVPWSEIAQIDVDPSATARLPAPPRQ